MLFKWNSKNKETAAKKKNQPVALFKSSVKPKAEPVETLKVWPTNDWIHITKGENAMAAAHLLFDEMFS